MRKLDLTGQQFGRWTAIERGPKRKAQLTWNCICQCGNTGTVGTAQLTSGHSRSCGCLNRELTSKANTRASGIKGRPANYSVWHGIKNRCLNPKAPGYRLYGGRGITICPEWCSSFAAFDADMGPRPSPGHSIDRIDNALGYFKENCRWATPEQQASNKRTNRLETLEGKTMTRAAWARSLGLARETVGNRLKRGWPLARALTTPNTKTSTTYCQE